MDFEVPRCETCGGIVAPLAEATRKFLLQVQSKLGRTLGHGEAMVLTSEEKRLLHAIVDGLVYADNKRRGVKCVS